MCHDWADLLRFLVLIAGSGAIVVAGTAAILWIGGYYDRR